jgi:hypothetical protein
MSKIDLDSLLGPIDLDALLGGPVVARRDPDEPLAKVPSTFVQPVYKPRKPMYRRDVNNKLVQRGLVVLSNGLGRDSATMMCLLVEGRLKAGGKIVRPEDVDVVVFSDTGYEWGFSYQAIASMTKMLEGTGIPFFVLRKPPTEAWRPWAEERKKNFLRIFSKHDGQVNSPAYKAEMAALKEAPPWLERELEAMAIHERAEAGIYHRRAPIVSSFEEMSRLNMMSSHECTIQHKIEPIRRFLEDLTVAKYGVKLVIGKDSWSRQVERGEADPHRVLIGFASDEGKRVARSEKALKGVGINWKIEEFPLFEMGISKDDETTILKRHGLNWIRKSGCIMCHHQPVSWFWALRENDPEGFKRMERYEANALTRNPTWHLKFGSSKKDIANKESGWPIGVLVDEWRRQNPNATVEDVLDKSYVRCT